MAANGNPRESKPRRGRRLVLIAAGVVAFLGGATVIGVFAAAWYHSNNVNEVAFVVKHEPPRFDLRVRAIDGNSVVIERTSQTGAGSHLYDDGFYGLEWAGGYARVGEILQQDEESVTRMFEARWGAAPQPGDAVLLDIFAYPPDPRLALGLTYENVTYLTPAGYLPAWYVPGARDAWVIFVHGKGSSCAESLRAMKATSEAGYPGLAISYRNDTGAPASESGRYDYGLSEWGDVEGAVFYAKSKGARKVVLFGYSMGGGIVLSFMQRSNHAREVSGIILDAPVLCFGCVLDFAAERRHLPSVVRNLAKDLIRQRFDVNWFALDYRSVGPELKVLTRIFHGEEDQIIPIEHTSNFAISNSEYIDSIEVPGATHTGSWNIAGEQYETLVVELVQQAAGHVEAQQ